MKVTTLYVIILTLSVTVYAEDGYHIVKSPLTGCAYSFRDTPRDMPLIQSFPEKALLNFPEIVDVQNNVEIFPRNYGMLVTIQTKNSVETIPVFYWIHASALEAEEGFVDHLAITSAGIQNTSDNLNIEKIGDNSFHCMDKIFYFIRNNVRVHVNDGSEYWLRNTAFRITELIDEALIQADKINDKSLLHAPVINSVELQDDTSPHFYRIKLDAYDPRGEKLSYDYSGRGLGEDAFENGFLDVVKFEGDVNYFNIWVMNEDRIVTKIQYF